MQRGHEGNRERNFKLFDALLGIIKNGSDSEVVDDEAEEEEEEEEEKEEEGVDGDTVHQEKFRIPLTDGDGRARDRRNGKGTNKAEWPIVAKCYEFF